MTRVLLILLFILSNHSSQANVAISNLINESDLIIKGEVIEARYTSSESGHDMVATIQIKEIFYGIWSKSTIEVPFCKSGLHTCETYNLNENIIAFLYITPTVKTVFNQHGKIALEGKLKDSLSYFIKEYLSAKSKIEKVNLILNYVSFDPDFSFLSSELLILNSKLSFEQQSRILDIVLQSDSTLSTSRFALSEDIYERQPYRIIDYYGMLLVLRDSELKQKAIKFLINRLKQEKSNYLASITMANICQMARKKRVCKKILEEYNEENKWTDGTDSIDDNSAEIILKLVKKINN